MRDLRALVVDDSATNRRLIAAALARHPNVTVVGQATDGDEALKLALELLPDVITLDLEMPRMDGFTFLRLIMAKRPTPVIVVSGFATKENVFRALELGAVDFVAKQARGGSDPSVIGDELLEKIDMVRHLVPTGILRHRAPTASLPVGSRSGRMRAQTNSMEPSGLPRLVVCVGASTGGPAALINLVKRLPLQANLAMVIAQHMPETFTHSFAQRLSRLGKLEISEVLEPRDVNRGEGYVCPGGTCMEILSEGGRIRVASVPARPDDPYVPSVDRLFSSAAAVLGRRMVAVVLTGMGDDGSRSLQAVREAGGTILVEAPETAVVHSMPDAAVRTGLADAVLPLPELAERLVDMLK